MPEAQHYDVGNHGVMDGGASRATWHITSNEDDWTFHNELGWFKGGGKNVAPHILVDPFTGEIAQFFPADSRSLSLKNADTVRTNRTGKYNIQIEIVFTKGEIVNGKKYNSVAETPCKNFDKIVAWLRSLGIKDGWPGGKPVAFSRDTVSLDAWLHEGGHYGHNQVPGNDHVDPGPMPNLFGPKPTPIYAPYPGLKFFKIGRKDKLITAMGKALVRAGYPARYTPTDTFTSADVKAVKWFQQKQGWSGSDVDGYPGPETWKRLKVPKP
jgi:peptidoglycan hydrolase-like protein with peptidoglycan-binding domain